MDINQSESAMEVTASAPAPAPAPAFKFKCLKRAREEEDDDNNSKTFQQLLKDAAASDESTSEPLGHAFLPLLTHAGLQQPSNQDTLCKLIPLLIGVAERLLYVPDVPDGPEGVDGPDSRLDAILRLLCIAVSAPSFKTASCFFHAISLFPRIKRILCSSVGTAWDFIRDTDIVGSVGYARYVPQPLSPYALCVTVDALCKTCVSAILSLPPVEAMPVQLSFGITAGLLLQILCMRCSQCTDFLAPDMRLLTSLAGIAGSKRRDDARVRMQDVAWKALHMYAACSTVGDGARAACGVIYDSLVGDSLCIPTAEIAVFVVRTACSLATENQGYAPHATTQQKSNLVRLLLGFVGLEEDATAMQLALSTVLALLRSAPTPTPTPTHELAQACRSPGNAKRVALILQSPDAKAVKLAMDVLYASVPNACSDVEALVVFDAVLCAVSARLQSPDKSVSLFVSRLKPLLLRLTLFVDAQNNRLYRNGDATLPPALVPALVAMLGADAPPKHQHAAVTLVALLSEQASMQGLRDAQPACLQATMRALATGTCTVTFINSIIGTINLFYTATPAVEVPQAVQDEIVQVSMAAFTSTALAMGPELHCHDAMRVRAATLLSSLLLKTPALADVYRGNASFMSVLRFMSHPAYKAVHGYQNKRCSLQALHFTLEDEASVAASHATVESMIMSRLVAFTPTPTPMSQGITETELCPICYDALAENLVHTPCFHVFHEACLRSAIGTSNGKCPMCMSEVLRNILTM